MAIKSQAKLKWMKTTEEAALERRPKADKAAKDVFSKELSRQDQLEIVAELVETRSTELVLAYRNVIDVGHGYKTKRNKKGQQRLRRVPSVIFFVSRKWEQDAEPARDQEIPKWLFTYVKIGKKRKLAAIPTDVIDAHAEGSIQIQSGRKWVGVVPKYKPKTDAGTVTCVIERSNVRGVRFAMSCRHVFSISKHYHHDSIVGAAVTKRETSSRFGATTSIYGPMQNGPAPSLDAQLAAISDQDIAKTVIGDLDLRGFARSSADVPERLKIMTDRGAVLVRRHSMAHPTLNYRHPDLTHVVHRELMRCEFVGGGTIGGDSGSPIISTGPNPLLIGMHIGISTDQHYSFSIPAWEFMDPERYRGTGSNERWRLVRV